MLGLSGDPVISVYPPGGSLTGVNARRVQAIAAIWQGIAIVSLAANTTQARLVRALNRAPWLL